MQWVEDFHVVSSSDQNSDQIAAPALDQVLPILDRGLSRTKGIAAADVRAHIGWAHWMNNKMADREVGPAAEQNLRAALATDPTNAYANGMLGNWLLQNGGSLEEAIRDFKVALSNFKARPFIRSLQFGGLLYHDERGARAELIKAANDMRKAHEPIHAATKSRLLSFCYTVAINDPADLAESLSSVPTDESWQTYLWIDDQPRSSDVQRTDREFIRANLLELSGKRQDPSSNSASSKKKGRQTAPP